VHIVASRHSSDLSGSIARDLDAAAVVARMARDLAVAHFRLEGWGDVALPLPGNVAQRYQKQATAAVRGCSDVEVKVAEDTAIAWASAAFETLQRALSAPEAVESERERLLAAFLHTAFSVYRTSLQNGAGGRLHPAYQQMVDGILRGEGDSDASL
jgi:hypothetical protein